MKHRHPSKLADDWTFGQRAADKVGATFGSWGFISAYIALTFVWCGGNIVLWRFDRYPYQFYTFSVSVLAILMSAIILLAAKRIAEIDRSHAENAYEHITEVNRKQDEQLTILERQMDTSIEQHERIQQHLNTQDTRFNALDARLNELIRQHGGQAHPDVI